MAGVNRFEELVAWQRARALTAAVGRTARELPLKRDFALSDQLRRATNSVMSNIAEGFERDTAPEFNRFLAIAKASCAEVRSHLYAALDADLLTSERFNELMAMARSTSDLVSSLKISVMRRMSIAKR